ncbi:MAG: DUF2232 domain-containing protein [Coriobacteriia bacterium]|nr:DUF2232 domain-containing protein [Coriobacteriia bacterium]
MSRPADIFRTTLLAAACVLAGLLLPGLPILALPLAALGLARLWASGSRVLAVAAIAAASGLMALADPAAALLVAVSMAAAGPVAVLALRTRSPLAVGTALTGASFAATVGAQALTATWKGTTLVREVTTGAAEAVELVASTLGEADMARVADVQRLLVATWPATYLQVAAAAALLATAAAGLGAQLGGLTVRRFPPLSRLDLPVHVLWLPVAAIGGLAAGRIAGLGWLQTAALNALLVSRVPLALQGLGVFAATYERVGLRKTGRVLGYALAVFVELTTYAISLVGLIDFWANFRRLPRDGAPQGAQRLEEPGAPG